jgi:Ca-activated chloride channel family protein
MKRTGLFVLIMLLTLFLLAQEGLKTNSIIGEIRGHNNRLLPKVRVEAYKQNQLVASTNSDLLGRYRFDFMQQGNYRLTFQLEGYAPFEIANLQLLEGAPEIADVVMTPVARGQTSSVTPPVRDSLAEQSIAQSGDIHSSNIRNDAMGSQRPIDMGKTSDSSVSAVADIVALQPGVTGVGSELHVRGGRANEINYMVDGMALQDYSGIAPPAYFPDNMEDYAAITPNIYHSPITEPLSTFSIDVDTATYSNTRRMLSNGYLPDPSSVRIEELINYFDYDYPEPEGEHPFSIYTELAACPWNEAHQLLHIGLRGRGMDMENAPASNLTFLIDVSGSMSAPNKLPLVQQALSLLVDRLRPQDRIGIVTYASGTRVALQPSSGDEPEMIKRVINGLRSGGSTAGAAGIQLAYELANQNLDPEANNRIILLTDGDFNVGITSQSALEEMIVSNRNKGIFLTILGFGMGNYKDARMEMLADKGNGNYAYIDNLMEAKKVLVHGITSTLFTIAKDVKIQAEFNPAHVRGYRLIGYENRMLRAEDFRDDTKDAGELGAGHTVTALYELIPAGSREAIPELDSLRYQSSQVTEEARTSQELAVVKLRYKLPSEDTSIPLESPVLNMPLRNSQTSDRFRFAASVAGYGLLLQNSSFKGNLTWDMVQSLASRSLGADPFSYGREFLQLLEMARQLQSRRD